jgi:cobalamin biosynthesis Mg chelatase CobN
MQPNGPQHRPVMDVTARKPAVTAPAAPPAASASTIAVPQVKMHEAPALEADPAPTSTPAGKGPAAQKPAATVSETPEKLKTASAPTEQKTTNKAKTQASAAGQIPVGAIIGAILAMVALSAIAIAIYLKG